jgi:hypothetical protein
MGAMEAKDNTVKLSGCGNDLRDVGYLYCRVAEGSRPVTQITLHAPKVDCDRDSCVDFAVFGLDGNVVTTGSFKRGQTKYTLILSEFTGNADEVRAGDDGEYLITQRVRFNADTVERTMFGRGLMRLDVHKAGYEILSCDNSNKAFEGKITSDCKVEYTTGYRSVVCGKCGK